MACLVHEHVNSENTYNNSNNLSHWTTKIEWYMSHQVSNLEVLLMQPPGQFLIYYFAKLLFAANVKVEVCHI